MVYFLIGIVVNPNNLWDSGITVSLGIGIATDLDTQTITGITTGSVGGGVYKEVTIAITVGEITESFYNTGAAVINGILNFSGMSRLIGNIEYKELDGIR